MNVNILLVLSILLLLSLICSLATKLLLLTMFQLKVTCLRTAVIVLLTNAVLNSHARVASPPVW
nr:hypothetical protein [Cressdnaviricota sp.]